VAAIVVQSIFRNFLKIIFEINVLKQFKNLKQLILIKKFNFLKNRSSPCLPSCWLVINN